MRTPATVRIDDDLSASQTGITLRSTDDESARRLNMVDGLVVEQVGGDDRLDDLLQDLLAELLGANLLGVLSRDNDGIDTDRDNSSRALGVLLVLDGDLGLGLARRVSCLLTARSMHTHVWSEPSKVAISALIGHLAVKGMRQDKG